MDNFMAIFEYLSGWFEQLVAMFGHIQEWFGGLELGE
jgi:hypothetical protein